MLPHLLMQPLVLAECIQEGLGVSVRELAFQSGDLSQDSSTGSHTPLTSGHHLQLETDTHILSLSLSLPPSLPLSLSLSLIQHYSPSTGFAPFGKNCSY